MNQLPVTKCLDVLNIFHARNEQDLWVNEIVRRVTETTGSRDTPAIKNSIKLLERASVIETISSSKHAQKEIKILTPLGQEVFDFIQHLKRCSHSYSGLKDIIVENNPIIGKVADADDAGKILNRKLLKMGWDHHEINSFTYIMRTAFRMETIYRNNIFNSILHRYSTIIADYDVNDTANKIIQQIMMNEIQSLFHLAQELERLSSEFSSGHHYFDPEDSDYKNIPFVDIYDLILEQLENYYHEEALLLNNKISNIIEEVTLSLLLLLQPDKEAVLEYIKEIHYIVSGRTQQENILERLKKKNYSRASNEFERLTGNLSVVKLRDIYKKYLGLK